MRAILLSVWIIFTGVLEGMAQNPLGLKSAKPESAYAFTSSMTYKITTTNRKGKSTWVSTQYFFSGKGTAVGMKFVDGSEEMAGGIDFMIMDIGQAKVFTFMESKMVIGMAMQPDKFTEMMEKENEAVTVTRTEEVKTILGYECEGYSVKNAKDKTQVTMWVSRKKVASLADLGKQMAKALTSTGKGAQNNYFAYNAHPELAAIAQEGRGILGYTSKSDKGETTEMELAGIEPKITYTFNASSYKSMF